MCGFACVHVCEYTDYYIDTYFVFVLDACSPCEASVGAAAAAVQAQAAKGRNLYANTANFPAISGDNLTHTFWLGEAVFSGICSALSICSVELKDQILVNWTAIVENPIYTRCPPAVREMSNEPRAHRELSSAAQASGICTCISAGFALDLVLSTHMRHESFSTRKGCVRTNRTFESSE